MTSGDCFDIEVDGGWMNLGPKRSPSTCPALRINDPAPHGERDGMGAIARSELGQDGLHVSFDGIFRHSEKLPNTFVRASYRHQAQDVELTRREFIFGKMAGELEGHFHWDTKFADVRTSNRVYQVTT
jgi:hypothetical protein